MQLLQWHSPMQFCWWIHKSPWRIPDGLPIHKLWQAIIYGYLWWCNPSQPTHQISRVFGEVVLIIVEKKTEREHDDDDALTLTLEGSMTASWLLSAWWLESSSSTKHRAVTTCAAVCTQRKNGDTTTRVIPHPSVRNLLPTSHACCLPLSVRGGSQGRSVLGTQEGSASSSLSPCRITNRCCTWGGEEEGSFLFVPCSPPSMAPNCTPFNKDHNA